MSKFVFSIAVLLLPCFCLAQLTTKDNVKGKAKEYYEAAYVSRSIYFSDSLARLAIQEKPDFIDAWILVGDNSFYLKKYDDAAKAYEQVKTLSEEYLGDINLRLAKSYIGLEKYPIAKNCLEKFLAGQRLNAADKMLANKLVTDCDFAEEAMKHPLSFTPTNMGPNINSALNEAGPYMTADGRFLYYTRLQEEANYEQEDIYYSEKNSDYFASANPVSDAINTFEHGEGSVCVSASGKYLMFSTYDRADGLGNSDIYIARKVGDQWERANNLGSPINSPGWEGAPSLSADGKTLFFSSIRSGGVGQRDIWMSSLNENGAWSTPVNLGDSVNTPYNDESPFIHPDGQTLYFSSAGWPGMGNYDLYMSKKQGDGSWGKAINLGYPINTSGYEVSIFVSTDGYSGFYSSERKDSYGGMDIYQFGMPEVNKPNFTSYIKGNVYDSDTRQPIATSIHIYDLESDKLYATLSSDKVNGTFLSTLPTGRNYGVEVQKDGYLFYSQNISLMNVKGGAPFIVNIPLRKIKVGEAIILDNIFFESQEYELKPASKAELGVLLKLMEKNPTLKVEIGGHTDNTGNQEKNLQLSEKRAKEVFYYLRNKGIDESRISYKGYASSKPIAANTTEEGKAKNRRTEMVVKEF